jgi:hypothetical protein
MCSQNVFNITGKSLRNALHHSPATLTPEGTISTNLSLADMLVIGWHPRAAGLEVSPSEQSQKRTQWDVCF